MHHIGVQMQKGKQRSKRKNDSILSFLLFFFHRIICGLTAFTTRNHIIRAALEAICFQTVDILDAIEADLGVELRKFHVDGPMTSNNLLMQLQADLSGIPVCKFYSILLLFSSSFDIAIVSHFIDV